MIEVSHVSRNFGDFRAVNDVSFSIPTGQIIGLLGPNGAGKTTTMKMILGLLQMDSGEITVDGKKVAAGNIKLMRKLGINCEDCTGVGTIVHIAVDGEYVGYITLADELKQDAQPMVNLLHHIYDMLFLYLKLALVFPHFS